MFAIIYYFLYRNHRYIYIYKREKKRALSQFEIVKKRIEIIYLYLYLKKKEEKDYYFEYYFFSTCELKSLFFPLYKYRKQKCFYTHIIAGRKIYNIMAVYCFTQSSRRMKRKLKRINVFAMKK